MSMKKLVLIFLLFKVLVCCYSQTNDKFTLGFIIKDSLTTDTAFKVVFLDNKEIKYCILTPRQVYNIDSIFIVEPSFRIKSFNINAVFCGGSAETIKQTNSIDSLKRIYLQRVRTGCSQTFITKMSIVNAENKTIIIDAIKIE
jgi:hypothetical protein